MDSLEIKKIVEAALLAADGPLTVKQLERLFRPGEADEETLRDELKAALKALAEEARDRGYELKRVASGFRYQIRQELSPWISRLWEEKPPRYTRALLETLALVAYRQPVTRGDIEQVRGVSVSQSIMRTLLERGWIRVVGQREVPGRPAMYGTTREFLDYFNLKSLDELPPLAEIRELIEPVLVAEAEPHTAESAEPAEASAATGGGAAGAQNTGAEASPTGEGPGEEAEADSVADERLAVALSVGEDASVDLDGDAFEAEIAAALAAADAASERFNAAGPDGTAEDPAGSAQAGTQTTDVEPEADNVVPLQRSPS